MTSIDIKVAGASIVASADGNLTSGMVGIDVRIEYDSSWDHLSKTAIFRVGRFERSRENIGTTTTVPWEVVRHHGKLLQVGIVGKDADGNIVMPTIWTSVGTILPGANEAIPGAPNPDRPDEPSGGGAVIDDGVISPDKTWSSRKIASEIQNAGGGAVIDDTKIDAASTWSSKNIVDKLCPAFTKSGTVVTCTPVEGYPLEVVSGLVPDQNSASEPSPDNICPINGYESIVLWHENGTDFREFTADFGQTVYGGSFNWATGELVSNMVCLTFTGDEAWEYVTGGVNTSYAFLSIGECGYVDAEVPPLCSHFRMYTITSSTTHIGADVANSTAYNDARVRFRMNAPFTLEGWIAFLKEQYANGTPVQVCFGVSTPTTAKLTAQEILALPDVNTLYADHENITVTGKANPALIIADQDARIAALEAALVNT